MMKRMSISHRLMLFLPVLLSVLAVMAWFGLTEQQRSLIEDRKQEIKSLVEVADSIVKTWYAKENAHELTREQAQLGARNELASLRFADNNYFFVQRYDGVTMVHVDRSLEGKPRLETVDPDGVPTVQRQIAAAQRGGDYIRYRNPRTGGADDRTQLLVPKLSYALGFAPWEWAICVGIYIDDVDAIYFRIVWIYVAISLVVVVLACSATFWIARSISS